MKLQILTAMLAGSLSFSVQAVPPHYPDLVQGGNLWNITAYNDASPVQTQWATQGLCFYYLGTLGTHQRYYWVSTTFPDWNGMATQEGDQVFMHGDYAQDRGHDGMQWEIVTNSRPNEGAGHWHEWRENGGLGLTIGFANAKFARVGSCPFASVKEALENNRNLPRLSNDDGRELENPMGARPDEDLDPGIGIINP